jgi:hypothetical protein
MHKVYLAGPIWGLEYDEGQDWRRVVKNSLAPVIDCYSPLRGHEFLRGKGQIVDMYYDHSILDRKVLELLWKLHGLMIDTFLLSS